MDGVGGGLHDDRDLRVTQSGLALEQRRQRGLGHRQLLTREEAERGAARAPGQGELDHHGQRCLHVARAEPVHGIVVGPAGRLSCCGTVSRWPASTTGPSPTSTQPSPASRAPGTVDRTCCAIAASSRDSDGMSTSSSVPRREPARQLFVAHPPDSIVEAVRYCGIDVAAKPSGQQLCTLHERRGPEGTELVATFFQPGDVDAVANTVRGFGGEAVVAIDAPSGRRLDLLAAGAPLRDELALPAGRYERSRVCDALLFRRGLPLYPVPAADQALARWESWMDSGFALFAALEPLGLFRPGAAAGRHGSCRRQRDALRPPVRDVPRRGLLLAPGPPAEPEAHAVGVAAADCRATAARRRRRRRRALAPHAGRT